MGVAISTAKSMIDSADDAKGKEDEIKEALENMRQMAADQLALFNSDVRNVKHDAFLVPISRILNDYQYIHCTMSKQDAISSAIKTAVSDFSHGPAGTAIADTAENVIRMLLGSGTGERLTKKTYSITIDPLGGVSRLDTYFFVYNFSSKGLMKTAKSVVASCIVKSSVDTRSLDDNTLRVLVNECFEKTDIQLRKQVYVELKNAIFHPTDPKYLDSLRTVGVPEGKEYDSYAAPRAESESHDNSEEDSEAPIPPKGLKRYGD